MKSENTTYSLHDIIKNFSGKDYLRGHTYAQQGKVKNILYNSGTLSAKVQGTRKTPYQVTVEINNGNNNTKYFKGYCSCPVEFQCKHIVATLLAWHHISSAEEVMGQPIVMIGNSVNVPKVNATPVQEGSRIIDVTFTETKALNQQKPNEVVPVTDTAMLDPNLTTWLECLQEPQEKPSPNQGKILIYIIEPTKNKEAFTVSSYVAYILKKGGFSDNKTPYTLNQVDSYNRATYVQDSDVEILSLIAGLMPSSDRYRSTFAIPAGTGAILLLKLLMDSNRCYLTKVASPSDYLTMAQPRNATISWKTQSDGTQTIHVGVEGTTHPIILPLTPPHYICPISRTIGIANINSSITDQQLATLLKAPAVKPQQASIVSQKLSSILGTNTTELLPAELPICKLNVKPIPVLKLTEITIQPQKVHAWHSRPTGEKITMAAATLSFDYQGKTINYYDHKPEFSRFKGGEVQIIARDKAMEQEQMDHLRDLGFGVRYKDITNYYSVNQEYYDYITIGYPRENFHKDKTLSYHWKKFVEHEIPRLKEQGWQIKFFQSFPYGVVHVAEEWYGEIHGGENNWFDVELGVNIEGNKVNLIPILLNLLKKDSNIFANIEKLTDKEPLIVSLKDGRRLALAPERIKALLGTLQYLFSFQNNLSAEDKLRMEALDAALLAEIEASMQSLNMRWFGGERVRELGKKLKNFEAMKTVPIPPNFQGQLRAYQQEGLNWLQFLREYNLAGILADDMGLGKTVQVLAHIASEKANNPLEKLFLVIAPTSLMTNWRREAERFVPSLKVLTLHGIKRKEHFNDISKYDVILTTYPLLLRDKEILLKHEYHTIILDEAQTIKNSNAKITQITNQLKANHRLCMTGTPLENHLGELWSLFNFLLPGYLGTSKQFVTLFRNPIEKDRDTKKVQILTKRIRPFILRRTKQAVITELPSKTEIVHLVELEGEQRDLYETIRISMHEKIQKEIALHGMAKSHIIVLDALLKLRQVCCDPSLLKMDEAKKVKQSAKRTELIRMLKEMVEEGRKILLFSQFTSMLEIIEQHVTLLNISYVKLTGQTKDRETPIRSFQEGNIPLFLISLKAGGTGLNLTAADTVIHYDPWWNPAAENQATDRAYRIGQNKPVFVYKLITSGTVEEKIIEMQKKKAALINNLFDPTAKASAQLTADDIKRLFDPLDVNVG